MTAYSLSL